MLPGRALAQAWPAVPGVDFSTLNLSQFDDRELEVPYFLRHFAQVANAVVESGPDRGFLNLKVNREPADNQNYNARVMENQLSLAYFYTARRPWNPYYGHPAVRVRLEAMLSRWAQIQNQPGSADGEFDGLYAEYSPSNWSLAPTSFGARHAAETLDLIIDSGLPFDATTLENGRIALRRALMALFTRPDMRNAAKQYSNQFSASYHAALLYLENWPDAQLDGAFVTAVNAAAKQDQSPAGFWYEAGGPDYGYSEVHENNLRVALPRLRLRPDLMPVVIGDDTEWNDWLAASYVPQPGLATRTLLVNAGLNTRTSHSYLNPTPRPMSELVPMSRSFASTDSEFASSLVTRRSQVQSQFGNWGALNTNSAYAYIPAFVHDAITDLNAWNPTAEQRTVADAALLCLFPGSLNSQFCDPRPIILTLIKRPDYYATFTTGTVLVRRQSYGLGLLWHPRFGLALQAVADTLPANPWAYGTRRSGESGGATYETATLSAAITVGGSGITPTPGAHDLPDGEVIATYPLAANGTTYGQKTITFAADAIDVDLTHSGAFTELLPLAHASDTTATATATRLTLQRPDGSSLLLELTSPSATLTVGGTSALTPGIVRRAVSIAASGRLSYRLTLSADPPITPPQVPAPQPITPPPTTPAPRPSAGGGGGGAPSGWFGGALALLALARRLSRLPPID
ncbi:MAG: hypothetical protein PSV13_01030 [Lacunisphaera sp.]|nr:hypothetical protein [Lacunisphaera sp.]